MQVVEVMGRYDDLLNHPEVHFQHHYQAPKRYLYKGSMDKREYLPTSFFQVTRTDHPNRGHEKPLKRSLKTPQKSHDRKNLVYELVGFFMGDR